MQAGMKRGWRRGEWLESGMYTCTVGPVSECAARTIYCAVAVADVADEKNAVSFLCEASGGPSSFLRDFFMPLLLALLLICVVPGFALDLRRARLAAGSVRLRAATRRCNPSCPP